MRWYGKLMGWVGVEIADVGNLTSRLHFDLGHGHNCFGTL